MGKSLRKYSNTSQKVDIIKGVLIFLVVYLHVMFKFYTPSVQRPPLLVEILNYLASFAVPLFLMLGGFFFSGKILNLLKQGKSVDLFSFFKGIIKRLFIPYYIFVFILVLHNYVIGAAFPLDIFLLIDADTKGLYFILIYFYAFLFALLSFRLLTIFKFQANRIFSIYIPIISLLFFPLCHFLIPWFPDNFLLRNLPLICMFTFGFLVWPWFENIKQLSSNNRLELLFLLGIAVLIFTLFLWGARRIWGAFPVFVSHPPSVAVLLYTLLLFVILLVVFVPGESFVHLGRILFLQKMGEESLFIFFLHPYLLLFIVPVLSFFCNELTASNLFFLPLLIASCLTSLLSLVCFAFLPSSVKKIFVR